MNLKKEIVELNKIMASSEGTFSDLKTLIPKLLNVISAQQSRIEELEQKLHKKTSKNSSLPPSRDENRPKKNQSLRQKNGKKQGGQKGHKGSTLLAVSTPDIIIKHSPEYCNVCGLKLGKDEGMKEKRQVIDIELIKPNVTEHRVYSKICSCGHCTKGTFPSSVKAAVSYGLNIEALIAYLSVRQFIPINRIKEYLSQVCNVNMSQGTIVNKLVSFAEKCKPIYAEIKERIEKSEVVGADETGYKLKGDKGWMWIWQTPRLTYIVASTYRGYKTIEESFKNGLPNAILVHDCWRSYFKMNVKNHQLCIPHLLRELNYFIELLKNDWSSSFRKILLNALALKDKIDELTDAEFKKQTVKIKASAKTLINQKNIHTHKKLDAFQRRMYKYFEYLFTFLDYYDVPPDNNASERGFRNVKVKLKVSGHFNTINGAFQFACIRSVIDTSIKNESAIFDALFDVANWIPE